MPEISAELTLKVAGLQAGLEKARSELASFKKFAATQGQGIGAEMGAHLKRSFGDVAGLIGVPLGIGALALAAKGFAEHLDGIEDTAAALNSSVEGVQRLQYMAAGTSTPFEQMSAGLLRIKRALFEVDDETKQKALERLGLDAKTFMSLDADQAFIRLAESFQSAQQDGRGFSEVFDLVKKAAPDMIPALRESGDELRRLGDHAVMSADAVRNFTENLGRVKTAKLELGALVGESIGGYEKAGSAFFRGLKEMMAGGGFGKGWNDSLMEGIELRQKQLAERNMIADAETKAAEADKERNRQLRETLALEKARRDEREAMKKAEDVTKTEQDVQIKELRASRRFREADQVERLQKGQANYQRLRDAHPEMGEQWALDMAHRIDRADDRAAHPGRIQGFTGSRSFRDQHPLDWLYGHGPRGGGQSLRQEFKFPQLDDMVRLQRETVKALQE